MSHDLKNKQEALTMNIERDMWDNLEEWAVDPHRNPLLLGWYSFCQVLAEMALPALERLVEDNHGYPVGSDRMTWEATLVRIRDAFRQIVAMERGSGEAAYDHEFVAEGLRLFSAHFADLWD